MTITPSAALVHAEAIFSAQERLALTGFLAGYSGMTRDAYTLDLSQFTAWCHRHHLRLFAARRADIGCSPASSRQPGGPARLSPDG